jgi:hypothetical protein
MKKVYLSLFAIALASVSMAQGKVANKSALKAKNYVSVTENKKAKKDAVVSNKAILYTNTFNNAADWTGSNTSAPAQDWEFSTDPAAIGGWSATPFASTSVADGFAILDSDAAGQTATQDAYLTLANPIDLSANAAVVLTFEQYHTRFAETTAVEVSGDNGSTWTEYLVNEGVAVNASTANPDLITLNISAVAGGQSEVLIRFHYVGAWDYGWAVDDLIIEAAAGNDIVVGKAFTHDIINGYDYSIEAANQMQAMVVGVVLSNFGGTAAVGATLNVTINDGTSDVYTAPALYDLGVGASDTVWVTTGFMPESNKMYTISFSVVADDNTSNDMSVPVSYSTSDLTYAQDFTVDGIYRFNLDPETSMGNIFEVFNNETLASASVKFETGTTAVSAIIRVSRFSFNDANFNSVQNMDFVDEVEYTINASDIGSGQFTTINFANPISLEAGWNYVVEVRKNAGADRIFIGGSAEGDDDYSTVCFGPFGANSAENYFVAWGFSPAVRLLMQAPQTAPVITSSVAPVNNEIQLCQGQTVELTSSAATGNTWSSGETTQNITVSATGVYSVSTANGTSAMINVVVNDVALVLGTVSPSTCNGNNDGSIQINGAGTGDLVVNGNIFATVTLPFTVTNLAAGNYQIIMNSGACVSNTITATITDLGALVPTISFGELSFCAGEMVTLTSSEATGNMWSTGENTQSINVSTTETITLTHTNAQGCSSVSDNISTTMNPLPVVSAGVDASVCAGSEFTFSGQGALTYVWNNGVTNDVPFVVNSTSTFSVVGTDMNNCSNSASVTITTLDLPIVSAGVDSDVCTGSEFTFSGQGALTYVWNNGITNDVPETITATETYTLIGTDINNCSNSATITVTALDLPTVSAGDDQTICSNQMLLLDASGATTYTWDNGVVNNTPFSVTAGTTVYTVIGIAANGCSASDEVTVIVEECAGINENSNSSISIYPNPSTDNVTIKSNTLNQFNKVELTDQLGRVISTYTISGLEMNVKFENVSTGNYFLVFKGANAMTSQKIHITN